MRVKPSHRLWLLTLLTAIAFPTVPRAQESSSLPKISAIKIQGNQNVSNLLIYGHLSEKEGDLFAMRRVRMDIHNLFAMGDFKDVRVEALPGAKPGQIELTFVVVERPLIGKIEFKGNKKFDDRKLLEAMKLQAKSAYEESKLQDDIQAIRKLYLDEGYSSVVVTPKTQTEGDKNLVDLTLDINEGNQVKIAKILVVGSEAFSANKVAGQTKENKQGDKYKPDLLNDDLKAIEDFYHDEGYLRAVVLDHQEQMSPDGRKVTITITVREGVQYTLGDVSLSGNVLIEDKDMLAAFGYKKGDLIRKKDFDEAVRKMRSLYADKGYIYANVNPQMTYDDDLKKVNIIFDVTEGQMAYVQDIKIVGNYKTQDYVIRRELVIAPGDKFEADKIKLSVQNLYNLGFFEEVNPDVQPGDTPGKQVLVLRVKERKTGSISVGGGYSSVDGFVGNIKLEEANLFGKAQHVNLDLEFGASRTSYSVGFTEPWLFNTPTSFSLSAFNTTRVFTSSIITQDGNKFYTEQQVGGSISLGRRLSRFWSIYGTYSLQNVTISDVASYYTTIGTPQYIEATSSTTSSFTPRLVYDSRDNYFDPTTGWKHQLSIEFAGGPLGFDNNFIKAVQDSSVFVPLPAGFVIGEHVRLGAEQGYWFAGRGYRDVPVYEKFYAGGTDTIRGYNERAVGPLAGGNALFVSNTELKHPLVGPLRGVLFFDTGDSWTNVWSLNESNLQMGAGLGVRLTIPGTIMDIRLDYGWPIASNLSAAAAPPGGVLHFNLGNLF
ncbi:MAG TPA: outer membrane protein assembly factor BamA [bacterium]|nr:outer membrane protein assembly factor BamA [bacterium]